MIILKVLFIYNGLIQIIRCYKKFAPHRLNNIIHENNKNNIGTYDIKSKALKKLYERKLIHYVSDIRNIDKILYHNENEKEKKNRKSVYAGIDLTCKYLHLGNLVPLITLDILRNHNTDVIILLGNSTTQIGDPSFQKVERQKTLEKDILENEENIRRTIIELFLQREICEEDMNELIKKSNIERDKEFIYESDNKGSLIILKNSLWYDKMNIIDFLKYGEYFSINKLLRKECFLNKIKKNLTLKDLNYITLQSFDFLHLFNKFKTCIQIGGSDQWGNIQSGIELAQYISNTQLYGLTTNLLVYKNNIKYSKSQFNENKRLPIWIDKNYNSPYLFWNFLRNVEDQKVQSYIDMLTNLKININQEIETVYNPMDTNLNEILDETLDDSNKKKKNNDNNNNNNNVKDINITTEHNNYSNDISLEKSYEEKINQAKKQLSDSVTSYIFGEHTVKKIHKMKDVLKNNEFHKINNIDDIKVFPYVEITMEHINKKQINISDLLKKFDIASTNKEAKEKISQNCIYLNELLINDSKYSLNINNFIKLHNNYYAILRLGKRTSYSIIIK
ncbi:tyrosine--tRNA ligase [Plasmodium falciparum NF54]|uniref:Tyrosine--tRNA ligase n=3 Tax=Plasmodium falciparum TaxID=5833 RepID=Q8IIJ2_PLAF7|nr:tyrosine--tRNA ligase [Plasmodium falciparum 3D7]ETW35986.1 tyrosine-tRNA ligase [Plasmodium falciparum Tanzania (2000708)]KAF4331218.1 tyrosine--tRNA ligase [Plasmodium falciparum NF54]PKC49127.1 tyrosine--tRNA ligase [Plasmodium falciparum NF54]CZT98836.1 tyrosine--tRNA ligase [Plasmodium falciparum 3D7]|eukprot:XP_001347852.2 tyrosine--tRNA ligase [Plasmodium falciparum 3D7]